MARSHAAFAGRLLASDRRWLRPSFPELDEMDAPASRGRPMQLKLYDTLTRQKRDFVPLDRELGLPEAERRLRMYVCGPTVYDFAHIGNARPVIVFDVLFRLLRHLYGNDRVVYVRNITDVDDRINARAAELGVAIRELTERTYRGFAKDVRAPGLAHRMLGDGVAASRRNV